MRHTSCPGCLLSDHMAMTELKEYRVVRETIVYEEALIKATDSVKASEASAEAELNWEPALDYAGSQQVYDVEEVA